MQRWFGGVLMLVTAAATAAQAASGQAQFVVQVTVPPRVALEVVDQPSRLLLSEADVERGYKDLSARYVVSQNTRSGWLLRLSPRLGVTRQVEVRGLSRPVLLAEDCVEIYRPGPEGRQAVALEYRFVLAPGAQPGSYELPVLVSVAPP